MKSEKPKVLHTIGGQSLLEHVNDTAQQLAADSISVVVGHNAEQVTQALAQFTSPTPVSFVEQTEQLGTGHAVMQALPFINDHSTTLILCGDVPLIKANTLQRLISLVDEQQMGLLTIDVASPEGYGRILREEGQVVGIVEQKDATAEQAKITEINTGIMAVRGEHLKRWLPALSNANAQGEYYLTDIIALACNNGVNIATDNPDSLEEVIGINNRAQQAQLERAYQRLQAERLMELGVQLMDPSRIDCRGEVHPASDVIIDINCVFEGQVTLGNNVHVGANCIISNATIGDNTTILANSVIDQASIGSNATIGPFARLRPGTVLGNYTKVGNFVETKKTVVGDGSKINHLSYIGDTHMGKGVNVGAGTITCNYDGVNKHTTTIEDDVFVGSNSALVAPVTIGKESTVGAGSTITKSVEPGTLSLTRALQKTVKDWQRPEKK